MKMFVAILAVLSFVAAVVPANAGNCTSTYNSATRTWYTHCY